MCQVFVTAASILIDGERRAAAMLGPVSRQELPWSLGLFGEHEGVDSRRMIEKRTLILFAG